MACIVGQSNSRASANARQLAATPAPAPLRRHLRREPFDRAAQRHCLQKPDQSESNVPLPNFRFLEGGPDSAYLPGDRSPLRCRVSALRDHIKTLSTAQASPPCICLPTVYEHCIKHFFLSAAIGTFALCLSSVSAAPTLVTSKKLSARGSTCHGPDGKIWSAGDSFVCRGNTATRGAALRDFGDKDIGTIATSLTDWIFSRLNEKTGSVGKRGRKRRSLCRPTPANATVEVEVGKSVISLPYTAVADGRVTIDITAYLSASADNVTARAIDKRNGESVSVVTLVGGSATYFRDGGLDTCTLDYAILSTGTVPSGGNSTADAAATTDARLAKRGYWTLHTTYWADSGHDATDLNWNDIHNLALASYHSLPKGISEACGYMANSGSWHGAFRHWTGDNGSTLGECWFDREF
ncbi:hypothetical protein C6P46_003367 [Rhodotorula mucilaginosa]|uniref:Uncharacterized protein n=1 Tax=Rhodotorula mucilaginosa TaxID=5537 RepID=A0A9P7B6D2_RHOMI|nr:hypothetical protein C6P46_003367 [Rhodotorula mucilaginosa]